MSKEPTKNTALDNLNQAQTLLEQVNADNDRLAELVAWVIEAGERAQELDTYNRGQGLDDIAAVLGTDPGAVTPPVGNEDAAWEALAVHHDQLLRLLKVVVAEVTSDVDED